MGKGLSKSRYMAFCQCPKNLWLKVYKPDGATVDEALQARFEQGNVVGDLAMGLFGDYKEAHVENPDGSLNLGKMAEQTRQWMEEGVEIIAEAKQMNDLFTQAIEWEENAKHRHHLQECIERELPRHQCRYRR